MNYRTLLTIRFLFCILPIFPIQAILAAPQNDDNRTTPLVLSKLSGPITLDGINDEQAWQSIESVHLTMLSPIYRGTMTERTELKVAYDDTYLYLSGRMYDSDPDGIQAVDMVRDAANWQNDWMFICLDSFNDNENILGFATNPVGIRTDFTTTNDNPGSFSTSWNTFWDVATHRNDQGWFAEIRIPFSSLRFQDDNGAVILGLTVARYIARKGETHVFPAIPPNWGGASFWKASQAQRVLITGINSSNPLYITPYALGGVNLTSALDLTETAYEISNTPTSDIGVDVKYSLTSNLTLDLTFNTDFAQVEADDQQINLTRFSLFFPEKRLFFQERASTFEFGLRGYNRLFHSRRIGIYEGKQVPIYGGARLVGRVGGWDLAALNMQSAPLAGDDGETILPSENMGVARLRRQVLNPFSYVGGMVTNRMDADGNYNRTYGLDGIFRLFGENYLTTVWAQNFDSDWEEAPDILNAGQISLNWTRRGVKGIVYNLDYTRRGDSFKPGLGFVDRTDITSLYGRLGYGWFSPESSPILSHIPSLQWTQIRSTSTGQVESMEAILDWTLETKKRASAIVAAYAYYEDLDEYFELSDSAYVPPGEYNFYTGSFWYAMDAGKLLTADLRIMGGEYYDGQQLSVSLSPTWRPNSFFMTSGSISYDQITFPKRDQEFVNWIYGLNMQVALNATTSVASMLQYNSNIDAVILNLRMRYNPREGTDLYLVYNDNLNTDRQQEVPALPLSNNRAILLKYSTTFLTDLR